MSDQIRPAAADPAIRAAIVAGCIVAFISFGFAATFGVFLRPMSEDLGWSREVFSLSLALQALFWGITQPLAGMVADRFGAARILGIGAIVSGLGFLLRGVVLEPEVFVLAGVIVGIGTGACSFQVVIVALGKVVSPQRRSFILGLGTAAASTGMFAAAPALSLLQGSIGWQNAILLIAASYLIVLPALIFIARVSRPTVGGGAGDSFGMAIRMAFADKSYVLLFFGFFVCGFHVSFIQTHLPAYIADQGLAPVAGALSLGLIGMFNIMGSFASGWSGQIISKRKLLSAIYAARAVVILTFILVPLSLTSVIAFSAMMGLLWLSTVPPTTGLVAQTQGLRFLATLAGLVFLSHQTGAFIGAWLGGRIYDATGSYEPMWWAAIVLGLLATLIHMPIRETPGPLALREQA
ncbi:MFS transporter [Ponticoccus sp. SC2-23]|uniref:MFS transporter n=1 Tax=Alexandriicola marinus TaxID=2081710 RepID=UPI000FD9E863|nr:MFS transporter [Alexandriicola marinus]MBM1219614.1 MFS transporter [Ponticoccus sp. SC6-9]MBM1223314.1 MFS transporter [Ponticoccus sp. SC6-15]MBM1229427.1 MFS transporter [Ponticoccus sp. SC6-38]MBM1232280.1 MFS transporter [Ponticoccus sp. SC6-45]MBM1237770.1 MFS transporter [Ponticoccus sp. SC6-49]MBM1241291.1 MFS transporter [Ponticoccus sp. SC2-64]MBM1245804.1 MFS transporter [Ponticoccus sp. SC6-42]MBM1250282.1 MFS transporter [Ponticoccus sp. SC6-33]MBM1255779.1 MFS transporter